jgi:protein-S-isoprenylcysteine O-methyltransferase Ste14
VQQRWSGSRRWYRLCYNTISLVTLVPLALSTRSLPGEAVFSWQGALATILRLALLLLAFFFFWGGARRYDFATFLGLRQLRQGRESLLLGEDGAFAESGVFALTRHPWYLGSFLLLWAIFPAYPPPLLLAVAILSVYLLLGSWLEERKILAEHGDSYRAYQSRVSMFFPYKWLRGRLRRG